MNAPTNPLGRAPMRRSIVVLSPRGLGLARRLRLGLDGSTTIYGPSCVVGRCGAKAEEGGRLIPTDEPGVVAWSGPLRLAWPEIWTRSDRIVAVMSLGIVVR